MRSSGIAVAHFPLHCRGSQVTGEHLTSIAFVVTQLLPDVGPPSVPTVPNHTRDQRKCISLTCVDWKQADS